MSKLPAFQFYPGDWRKDMGVQSLSFHDRGVWWEMLCLMHESERRGVLVLNSHPMNDASLARLLGLDNQILTTTITNLLASGVASREEDTGAIYSRRMVRDEKLRNIRVIAGSKGGNPILLNQKTTTEDKQIPTPSSSSSSSKKKHSQATPEKDAKTALRKKRHTEFKAAILRYWEYKNPGVEMPWGPAEGRNLEIWLRETPNTTLEQFVGYLRNRFKSAVTHTERPSRWIGNVTNFASGPIDKYGKPLQESANVGSDKNQPSPAKQRIDGARRVLAEIAIERGLYDPAGADGRPDAQVPQPGPAGEHR